MDVIYTDANGKDIGLLDCISIDYDTAGEKDFTLTMATEDATLENDAIWYVPSEEYYGVIEGYKISSEPDEVTYKGTNARGLLDKRIIETPSVKTYSGLFSDICRRWIEGSGLGEIFVVDDVELEIPMYQTEPYMTVYAAIIGALDSVNALLILEVDDNHMIHISADLKRDLSDEITLTGNNSHYFTIEKESNSYNHVILYSSEDSGESYTIHLFSDDNGGIQPYKLTNVPMQDSDYITDKRNQVMMGADERALAIKCDVSVTENYIPLHEKPYDWKFLYDYYYTQEEGEDGTISYKEVEGIQTPIYSLMSEKPENWDTAYNNYYVHNGSGEDDFTEVTMEATPVYAPLAVKPLDWETNWSVYYQREVDGTGYVYKRAEGPGYGIYTKMTLKPTDWSSNYKNYYKIGTVYKKCSSIYSKAPAWKKNTFYKYTSGKYVLIKSKPSNWSKTGWKSAYKANGTGYVKITGAKAPKFEKNKYYNRTEGEKPPTFEVGKYYYIQSEVMGTPTWKADYYWSKFDLWTAPGFVEGVYYEKVIDHYAEMVASGLERLKELSPSQKATMTLDEYEVRIGDIVGCTDLKSGISIREPVANIIYKINGAEENFEYTIGGE